MNYKKLAEELARMQHHGREDLAVSVERLMKEIEPVCWQCDTVLEEYEEEFGMCTKCAKEDDRDDHMHPDSI